jgi:hypothetical protein
MNTSPRPVRGPDAARGPLVVSTANPRYFTAASDLRRAVYLTGSHIWNRSMAASFSAPSEASGPTVLYLKRVGG